MIQYSLDYPTCVGTLHFVTSNSARSGINHTVYFCRAAKKRMEAQKQMRIPNFLKEINSFV